MADGFVHMYADLMAATLSGLSGGMSGTSVRFMRGIDEDEPGGAYLMCVVAGTPPAEGSLRDEAVREVVGYLRYSDGRWDGPRPVLADARAALLRDVGLAA